MRYERARWDTHVGRCTDGGLALIRWAHQHGYGDAGCYNDRAVRNASAPSLHREGRAVDLKPGTHSFEDFDRLVHQLVEHHEPLFIQQVIWNRQVWTVGREWRRYTGSAGAHTDHAHVEITWAGAQHLTVDLIESTLNPESTEDDDDMPPKQLIIRPDDSHPLRDHWYLATEGSPFIIHLATHEEVMLHKYLGAQTAPDGNPIVLPGYWFDELYVLTGGPGSGGRNGHNPLRVR